MMEGMEAGSWQLVCTFGGGGRKLRSLGAEPGGMQNFLGWRLLICDFTIRQAK